MTAGAKNRPVLHLTVKHKSEHTTPVKKVTPGERKNAGPLPVSEAPWDRPPRPETSRGVALGHYMRRARLAGFPLLEAGIDGVCFLVRVIAAEG